MILTGRCDDAAAPVQTDHDSTGKGSVVVIEARSVRAFIVSTIGASLSKRCEAAHDSKPTGLTVNRLRAKHRGVGLQAAVHMSEAFEAPPLSTACTRTQAINGASTSA